MTIDRIKGVWQQRARFAINLAYGVFQGFNGQGQILMLRIQEPPALAGGIQFIKRCQVDRTQTFYRARNALHFGLQPIGATQLFSRSEEHTSELQSLMRISYAVFCLKKKNK